MNLREAAVWMVQSGHPSLGWEWRGGCQNASQGLAGWGRGGVCFPLLL